MSRLNYYFLFFAIIISQLLVGQTIAQNSKKATWENPIETDGPDLTEASSLLPAGTVQIETAAMYTHNKTESVKTKTFNYPSALVRFGILPSFELRLIGDFERTTSINEASETHLKGITPLLVGTKIFICEEQGLRPQACLIGHLVLPTGSAHLRPIYTAPEFRFSFSNTLNSKVELGYNIGYEWDGLSTEGSGIYTLVVGYTLTKRWSTYLEVFGDKPEKSAMAHSVDGGIKFLVTPSFQLDLSGGHALNQHAPDYFVAYGARFRLPF